MKTKLVLGTSNIVSIDVRKFSKVIVSHFELAGSSIIMKLVGRNPSKNIALCFPDDQKILTVDIGLPSEWDQIIFETQVIGHDRQLTFILELIANNDLGL